MARVLYITANPKAKEDSYSLTVGDAFISEYKKVKPDDEVTTLNLYSIDVQLIDEDVLSAWGKFAQGKSFEELTGEEQNKIGSMNALLEQFMSADKYIFATPLWNLSVPPKMKAYIDNIFIAGKTFKYTENGPVGLLSGKKAVHIQARGGVYSSGPAAELELGDRYLKTVMNFLGVTDFQSIFIEGAAYAPDKAEEIKNNAIKRAEEVAKTF